LAALTLWLMLLADPWAGSAAPVVQEAAALSDPPFWQQYGWYLAGALTLFLLQAALIVGLLMQRLQRRRAEKTARSLAGRVLTAHEVERARLARELHDDACQETARIAVDISHLQRSLGRVQDADTQAMLGAIRERTVSLAESLRLVSHDLHPTVLQHLGLVEALKAHCAEVERSHRVQVTLSAPAEAEPLNADAALGLFRIAQEALRNAAAHGHARRASVTLTRKNGELGLTIRDDGIGFDDASVRSSGGLGLVSIEERARLLQGWAVIRSRPSHGTTVDVVVPDSEQANAHTGGS
jgi:signal transduction histidine kinase